jgi:hypothetical protein
MSGTEPGLSYESEQALLNKLQRMLGTVPVGTKDLLRVLTHPDVIDITWEYVRAKQIEDQSEKDHAASIADWNALRDAADSFPEICPYCAQKWKFCIDYDDHISKLVEG